MRGGCGGVVVAGVLTVGISHSLSVVIRFCTNGNLFESLRLKRVVKLFSKGYDMSFEERRRRPDCLLKEAQFLIGLTLAPPPVTLPGFGH